MEPIGKLVSERIDILLKGFDPVSAAGFVQVPNLILKDPKLSVGAKLTYAGFLSYAWQKDSCFPGTKRLAEDLGMGERSVIRYIKELEKMGYVEKNRRGLGHVNQYLLYATVKKGKVTKHTR